MNGGAKTHPTPGADHVGAFDASETLPRGQSRVYGLAYQYVRNADEARDLAQEIFIRLYERIGAYEGGSFVAWMIRVARNLCIDRLRRKSARPPAEDQLLEDGFDLPDGGPNPEESWTADGRSRLVWRAMGQMSPNNRELILLKEIQGLNLQEIADLLQAPIGTIKSRSNRARLELAKHVLSLDPAIGG